MLELIVAIMLFERLVTLFGCAVIFCVAAYVFLKDRARAKQAVSTLLDVLAA
jgi:hypothetical protein